MIIKVLGYIFIALLVAYIAISIAEMALRNKKQSINQNQPSVMDPAEDGDNKVKEGEENDYSATDH